jgi:hypothetical protein
LVSIRAWKLSAEISFDDKEWGLKSHCRAGLGNDMPLEPMCQACRAGVGLVNYLWRV